MAQPWQNTLAGYAGNVKENIKTRQALWFPLAIVGILLASIMTTSNLLHSPHMWAVQVDGEVVGYVENQQELLAALEDLQSGRLSILGEEAIVETLLEFEAVTEGNFDAVDPQRLAALVEQLLTYTVPATVVTVDGEPVVALADEGQARQVVEEIKNLYTDPSPGVVLKEFTINEDIALEEARVEYGEIKDREEAVLVLARGTDAIVIHEVAQGESLWTIARKYDLTVEDLLQANPGISELLQIGQALDLVVPQPYITVATREMVTLVEEIPYTTRTVRDSNLYTYERQTREQGVSGEKEVTWEVYRENGEEIERTLVEEVVKKEPVAQVVAIGTKLPVGQGSGNLQWPMGRGSVTSRFGSRGGRLHQGVDIAAPTGTPISAADSGVVTMAGWNGGYGYTVIIDHGNGISTLYAHCSQILVSVGSRVNKGQTIARVGSTGNSTGPHLHFEVRVNGQPRDPMRYF